MSEKKTIFNKLSDIFTKDGVNLPNNVTNNYKLDNKEILRTQSKEEFELAKKQALQNKYLANTWQKVDNEMYQKALFNENSRIGSYSDFEAMEFYPEIAATLDIFSEEISTLNGNGEMINIYSSSKRVKSILKDLFINRLDLHTSLPMWGRNLTKYGDNFVLLNIDDKRGVLGCRQLPNYEIERKEGDLYNFNNLNLKENETKFIWKGKNIEYRTWQIAHFRLLGDDRKLPYGVSILEKVRKIHRMLCMAEDAMLIDRLTRAGERKVFKINVGNIDEADVAPFMDKIAARFKKKPLIDPQTGQMDMRYNVANNTEDYFVPVRGDNAPNPIDTLPGSTNLGVVEDIEHLQKKLFTALRTPKSFLNFDDATGDGKNLALQDIRFSRTINKIQQAIIQELNKIAIIHLYLLGFEDDLDNFTLTLNNPSTQAEMLKVEHMQTKISLYKDAVSDAGNGYGAMSMTQAQKEILGRSDDDIRQMLLEQRMEKAAAAELENTANVIKHTGLYDKVDKIYGDMDAAKEGGVVPEDGGEDGGPSGSGGGFGGGGFGDTDLDFGDEDETDLENSDETNNEDGFGDEESDANLEDDNTEADMEDTSKEIDKEFPVESIKKIENILTERKELLINKQTKKVNKYQQIYENKLMESFNKKSVKNIKPVKIFDKNLKINDSINKMINEIDEKLNL
jgi:hypothetical protein